MSGERILITGRLGRTERRTAKNGSPFLSATVDGRRIVSFNTKVIEEIEGLVEGRQIAVCGKVWSSTGHVILVVDGLLSSSGPIMRGRPPNSAAEPKSPVAPLFDERRAAPLNDDIPFAPERR